ncbi:MAG: c-type cytochrome domain-containing protein, partial [Desulfobacterales bacterium]
SSYKDVMKGSKNHPVVVPAKPEKSELIRRVNGESTPQMPLSAPALSDSDISTLEKWIRAGAPGPGE